MSSANIKGGDDNEETNNGPQIKKVTKEGPERTKREGSALMQRKSGVPFNTVSQTKTLYPKSLVMLCQV